LESTEEQGFKVSEEQLRSAITPKTKAMILNNPSNPTGMVYDESALRMVADVCVQHDLYVIADEIYYSLVYDSKQFTSFISLGDEVKARSILINGVSKSYAMTGWRIGYAAAPDHIAKVMANYLSHATSAPSSISQWAAVEALNGSQDGIAEMRKEFEERRNYIYVRMNQIPFVSAIKPEGAFYVMMNLDQIIGKTVHGMEIRSSDDFARLFLEKGLVAVVPCTGFGAPNYVRWSYATSMGNIKEGLDRLERFLGV
jgi:aspartate aminotransferase